MRKLLDHTVVTESSLDPTYLSAELPESPSEDVMEQSSLNLSDSVLETTIYCSGSILWWQISHTLVPLCVSTPQSKQKSMENPAHVKWHGFKVFGNNIDKTVKPRYTVCVEMLVDRAFTIFIHMQSGTGSTCTVAVTFYQAYQLSGPWRLTRNTIVTCKMTLFISW